MLLPVNTKLLILHTTRPFSFSRLMRLFIKALATRCSPEDVFPKLCRHMMKLFVYGRHSFNFMQIEQESLFILAVLKMLSLLIDMSRHILQVMISPCTRISSTY